MLEPDTYRNMFETDKLISSYKKLSELILTKVISSYTNITCIFQEKYKVLIKSISCICIVFYKYINLLIKYI